MTTVEDLFQNAADLGAGKAVLKYFRKEADEQPFKVIVVLCDDPEVNQQYLDALDREERAMGKQETP